MSSPQINPNNFVACGVFRQHNVLASFAVLIWQLFILSIFPKQRGLVGRVGRRGPVVVDLFHRDHHHHHVLPVRQDHAAEAEEAGAEEAQGRAGQEEERGGRSG